MRMTASEETPEGFGFLVANVMDVPEKDQTTKEVLKATGKTRIKSMGGMLESSSGFIPPSKQKNMQMRRSTTMGGAASVRSSGGGSSRSVGSGRSKSSDSRDSRASRVSRLSMHVAQNQQQSINKVTGCGCGCNHDAKGRCIKTNDSSVILKQRRRQLGIKPAVCNSAGDGLFVQKPQKNKKLPGRSKSFDFTRSWTLP